MHTHKNTSYWLDGINKPAEAPVNLPETTDVLVIGSGYTGLHAALQTARGGRNTLVIDKHEPGHGCSTRNGGQISTSIKPSLDKLSRKFGKTQALAIRQEGRTALNWIEEFLLEEKIDADFMRCGRFHAAHTPKHHKSLARDAARLNSEGIDAYMVSRVDQRAEIGTDTYHGGVVFPHHASLNPGKYHAGLLQSVLNSGAQVSGHTQALSIEKTSTGFSVVTSKGSVDARNVVVATNGYTGGLTPWLQRRVIPIGSYIIATEPLSPALMDELFPTNRIISDTCRVVYYYRPSPDRTRVLFGGRVTAGETDTGTSANLLHKDMCRIFPSLEDTSVTHSWSGTVAYSFDEMMHTGVHNGVHYSMGYCGSGVSMASYLGMRLGQKVLGRAEGRTALDNLPFPTRPLYTGKPWFLSAAVGWYRWLDQREYKRAV